MEATLETLKNRIPDYAKDIKLNLGSALRQNELSESQAWGTFLCCALSCSNPYVRAVAEHEAATRLSDAEQDAARAAAALMGMNNIFYRFRHLSNDSKFADLPAGLRMSFMANPGVPKADFELWSLAVSAVNGCGVCIESHCRQLVEHEVSHASMQAAVKIAAVIQALATIDFS